MGKKTPKKWPSLVSGRLGLLQPLKYNGYSSKTACACLRVRARSLLTPAIASVWPIFWDGLSRI